MDGRRYSSMQRYINICIQQQTTSLFAARVPIRYWRIFCNQLFRLSWLGSLQWIWFKGLHIQDYYFCISLRFCKVLLYRNFAATSNLKASVRCCCLLAKHNALQLSFYVMLMESIRAYLNAQLFCFVQMSIISYSTYLQTSNHAAADRAWNDGPSEGL